MAQVTEIHDSSALDCYRLPWTALVQQTPGATFFHSLDWLQCYWRHFSRGQRLRVLIVSVGAQIVGVLPLVCKREATRFGSLRVLTYPLHDWGSGYGPLGPHPTATLMAGVRYLCSDEDDWDTLDLRWIDKQQDRGRTSTAMTMAGLAPQERLWDTTAVIELGDSWREYLATRSPRFRSHLRRIERRAAAAGVWSFERHRPAGVCRGDSDPRWEAFAECLGVSLRSWQATGTDGGALCHAAIYDFFHEAHAAACRTGAADFGLLRLDGRPVAFAYNYHFGGRVQGVRMGFNSAYAALSPGHLLLAHMLRDGIQRGDRQMDLGFQALDFKRRWATSLAPRYRYTSYRPDSWQAGWQRLKQCLSVSNR